MTVHTFGERWKTRYVHFVSFELITHQSLERVDYVPRGLWNVEL